MHSTPWRLRGVPWARDSWSSSVTCGILRPAARAASSFSLSPSQGSWFGCVQKPDMSSWNLAERSRARYRRHFLVDNSAFHGELPRVCGWLGLLCVSDRTYSALWVQIWCDCGVGPRARVNLLMDRPPEPCWAGPAGVSRTPPTPQWRCVPSLPGGP